MFENCGSLFSPKGSVLIPNNKRWRRGRKPECIKLIYQGFFVFVFACSKLSYLKMKTATVQEKDEPCWHNKWAHALTSVQSCFISHVCGQTLFWKLDAMTGCLVYKTLYLEQATVWELALYSFGFCIESKLSRQTLLPNREPSWEYLICSREKRTVFYFRKCRRMWFRSCQVSLL